ncbi:MAG: hypothetical protein QW743_00165 [Candidatus Methanomethylicia archaeon]
MEFFERAFIGLGIFFIVLGVIFILVPLLIKLIPSISIERIPWIILWVYRSNGFIFATSPILIIIGIIYLIWILIKMHYGISI